MASLSMGRHKVSTGAQAIVSLPEVPRSTFVTSSTHKTTFDVDYLYPIYVEEIIPGDSLNLDVTGFVRTATPVFPIMDNLFCDMFFFFVPNRLVWSNWEKFMGQQNSPGDSIDYIVPQVVFDNEYFIEPGSRFDYYGIPTLAQAPGQSTSINALPLRAYDLIFQEWFRDQNLENADFTFPMGDGPDDPDAIKNLRPRGKRHDYFTSALPWPQKGNAVSIPLSGNAPVVPANTGIPKLAGPIPGASNPFVVASNDVTLNTTNGQLSWIQPELEADLTDVLAVQINTMRAGFAVQQLLERDARFGTRYVETLRGHFGVFPQDTRLQRPEYLGGSSTPINVTPIAQTTPGGGSTPPLGNLGATAMSTPRCRISSTFPEHGYVIGLINVRADISYQQGLHRMWDRRTRFDFPYPVFAGLGEQAILRKEIFWQGGGSNDEIVFGYQERYAEYRYRQSMISGKFRSNAPGTMDSWHLAQRFETAPVLDVAGNFIASNTPIARVLAAGTEAAGQQLLADVLFNQRFTRPLPVHGTPGLTRF